MVSLFCRAVNVCLFAVFAILLLSVEVISLGSSSTIAVSYDSTTVCGILAGNSSQSIQCFRNGEKFSILPNNVSYETLAGGKNMFCGLTSGGVDLVCWDTRVSNLTSGGWRIYSDANLTLSDLTVGNDRVCALQAKTGAIQCWKRGSSSSIRSVFLQPEGETAFVSITSGDGFSCGITRDARNVQCWGESGMGDFIEAQFDSIPMTSLVAGKAHVCGITLSGALICKGNNDAGQLNVPSKETAFYYSEIALGGAYTCALLRSNGSVTCWGDFRNVSDNFNQEFQMQSFESIVGGVDFVCGLRSDDLTVLCWGSPWFGKSNSSLGLSPMIPGPCVQDPCRVCGWIPNSGALCSGETHICRSCVTNLLSQLSPETVIPIKSSNASAPEISPAPSVLPVSTPLPVKKLYRPLWAYDIFAMVGILSGVSAFIYFVYLRRSRSLDDEKVADDFTLKKIHSNISNGSSNNNNVVDSAFVASNASSAPQSRSSSITQLSSLTSGRERNWEYALKHVDKAEVFTLTELALATRNFSLENKIGRGSFGTVYRGKLPDNREVAVKREIICRKKEREYAFESELTLLSRVHHKHLVGLVGFCEENSERLLVYDFMTNGSVHDMLHTNDKSRLNSWKMRIKIALDAARGIEYLHNYAVPPIIHRDIKTSNILLDEKWVGRVSDFGLSLKGPENEEGSVSIKAVGTLGYIDPEYYVLKVLTTKSDVYGFGVVLLELVTGKKAVFKEIEGNGPTGVVEYAGPFIVAGEVWKVLDKRVEKPVMNENEAVELLAYTAMMCVNLEGKERPSMSDVVSNLERALTLCNGSSGTFSPNFYSFN